MKGLQLELDHHSLAKEDFAGLQGACDKKLRIKYQRKRTPHHLEVPGNKRGSVDR